MCEHSIKADRPINDVLHTLALSLHSGTPMLRPPFSSSDANSSLFSSNSLYPSSFLPRPPMHRRLRTPPRPSTDNICPAVPCTRPGPGQPDQDSPTMTTSGQSNLTRSCIDAAEERFNRIRQVAPMCPPMRVSAHLNARPKRHLDRFSRFCTDHGRVSLYFTTGRPFLFLQLYTPVTLYRLPLLILSTLTTIRNSLTLNSLLA